MSTIPSGMQPSARLSKLFEVRFLGRTLRRMSWRTGNLKPSNPLHVTSDGDCVRHRAAEGDVTRLIFRPEMIDNQSHAEACLRGTLIYQKRGKNEPWVDVETESLATLKKGDSYQLLIKSGELLHLMKALGPLYWR